MIPGGHAALSRHFQNIGAEVLDKPSLKLLPLPLNFPVICSYLTTVSNDKFNLFIGTGLGTQKRQALPTTNRLLGF